MYEKASKTMYVKSDTSLTVLHSLLLQGLKYFQMEQIFGELVKLCAQMFESVQ